MAAKKLRPQIIICVLTRQREPHKVRSNFFCFVYVYDDIMDSPHLSTAAAKNNAETCYSSSNMAFINIDLQDLGCYYLGIDVEEETCRSLCLQRRGIR